jgi:hypothetical protein
MNKKLGNSEQVCFAKRFTAESGREKGSDLVIASNNKIEIVVSISNALDIFRLSYKGQNISFISPNGLYAKKEEFPHAFPAGMLYTCGLDSIGAREGYQLHGRLHSIPAELTELHADENGFVIEGDIKDTALFQENLVLHRRIESSAEDDEIRIIDVLENCGFCSEPYCMLYHINSGYPLVDEGTEIQADFLSSAPRTAWAEAHMEKMCVMGAPADNQEEMCYFHKLKKPNISLINKKIGLKLTVSYSDLTLPYLVEWKSQMSGNYVIGLEPCTSLLDDKFAYQTIQSGEKIENKVSIKLENI